MNRIPSQIELGSNLLRYEKRKRNFNPPFKVMKKRRTEVRKWYLGCVFHIMEKVELAFTFLLVSEKIICIQVHDFMYSYVTFFS